MSSNQSHASPHLKTKNSTGQHLIIRRKTVSGYSDKTDKSDKSPKNQNSKTTDAPATGNARLERRISRDLVGFTGHNNYENINNFHLQSHERSPVESIKETNHTMNIEPTEVKDYQDFNDSYCSMKKPPRPPVTSGSNKTEISSENSPTAHLRSLPPLGTSISSTEKRDRSQRRDRETEVNRNGSGKDTSPHLSLSRSRSVSHKPTLSNNLTDKIKPLPILGESLQVEVSSNHSTTSTEKIPVKKSVSRSKSLQRSLSAVKRSLSKAGSNAVNFFLDDSHSNSITSKSDRHQQNHLYPPIERERTTKYQNQNTYRRDSTNNVTEDLNSLKNEDFFVDGENPYEHVSFKLDTPTPIDSGYGHDNHNLASISPPNLLPPLTPTTLSQSKSVRVKNLSTSFSRSHDRNSSQSKTPNLNNSRDHNRYDTLTKTKIGTSLKDLGNFRSNSVSGSGPAGKISHLLKKTYSNNINKQFQFSQCMPNPVGDKDDYNGEVGFEGMNQMDGCNVGNFSRTTSRNNNRENSRDCGYELSAFGADSSYPPHLDKRDKNGYSIEDKQSYNENLDEVLDNYYDAMRKHQDNSVGAPIHSGRMNRLRSNPDNFHATNSNNRSSNQNNNNYNNNNNQITSGQNHAEDERDRHFFKANIKRSISEAHTHKGNRYNSNFKSPIRGKNSVGGRDMGGISNLRSTSLLGRGISLSNRKDRLSHFTSLRESGKDPESIFDLQNRYQNSSSSSKNNSNSNATGLQRLKSSNSAVTSNYESTITSDNTRFLQKISNSIDELEHVYDQRRLNVFQRCKPAIIPCKGNSNIEISRCESVSVNRDVRF